MAINDAALKECLELSHYISDMGLGINSKRAACELYRQIMESSADLGAYITSMDYIPSRIRRTNASVDAMKEVSKVIYLLNVAKDSGFFIMSAVQDAIDSAVRLSSCLNEVTAAYMGLDENGMPIQPVAPATEENPSGSAAPAEEQFVPEEKPAAPAAEQPLKEAAKEEEPEEELDPEITQYISDGFDDPI